MGKDICRFIKCFFSNLHLSNDWENTYISLVPKVDSFQDFRDFHPISLCNVIYEAIFKSLANCLKSTFS
jgi:hypothetical protein